MITETFYYGQNALLIKIIHRGKEEMDKPNKEYLFDWIKQDLESGVIHNTYPYSNFECAVEWKLV